jgi:ParB family chromosome partitioning protein
VQTTKKQGGKVIVEQRLGGAVTFHEGWLKVAEARKSRTATASGESLWNVRPHSPGTVKEATLASVEGGLSAAELGAACEHAETLFAALGVRVPCRSGDAYHLCETFAALLAMTDAEEMRVMACVMADTLDPGGPAVEAVLHACGTIPAEFWKPNKAFFDLVRNKRVIGAFIAGAVLPEADEAGGAGCEPSTSKANAI